MNGGSIHDWEPRALVTPEEEWVPPSEKIRAKYGVQVPVEPIPPPARRAAITNPTSVLHLRPEVVRERVLHSEPGFEIIIETVWVEGGGA